MAEIRIIIVDDHPIVRQGLRQVITSDAALQVVAEAGDGQTALELIQALQPDVVVLDIDMPGMDGFTLARELRARGLQTAIIFLTIHREEDYFDEALNLGARGYVLKDSATTDIVVGIKTVIAGGHYSSPTLTSYLVNNRRATLRPASAQNAPTMLDLTPTERKVLRLIAEYKTSKQIAEELKISYRTVETHRTNICTKLDIHGSHALMKYALAHQKEL